MEIHLNFVVTIPYMLDVNMSCTMHILFNDNKVKVKYVLEKKNRTTPNSRFAFYIVTAMEITVTGSETRACGNVYNA